MPPNGEGKVKLLVKVLSNHIEAITNLYVVPLNDMAYAVRDLPLAISYRFSLSQENNIMKITNNPIIDDMNLLLKCLILLP